MSAAKNGLPIALVTGATSGIGCAITKRLLTEGYEVYGIGRDFSKCSFGGAFHPIVLDLTKPQGLADALRAYPPLQSLSLLVNCAGAAYYGPHEELSPGKIHEMVSVNFEAPLVLTGLFLRSLKKTGGTIVNVSSVTARSTNNTYGCAYGATKAALTSFGQSLFEECRKTGVRVVTLQPDLTDTALYRNADFTPAHESDAHLLAEDTADALCYVLNLRRDVVVTEITIRPQKNRIVKKNL